MRFLIINSDYPAFLEELYAQHSGLAERSYEEQLRVRNDSLFGLSEFYPRRLRELGHEAEEFHINNQPLQFAWAREHSLHPTKGLTFRWGRMVGLVPIPRPVRDGWVLQLLEAQLEDFQPDVVLSHCLIEVSPRFWRRMRPSYRLLVGQHAATPLSRRYDWNAYDLMISSFPATVGWFQGLGVRAEFQRLGFDPSVLTRLNGARERCDLSFVGSLAPIHQARIEWLELVCRKCNTDVWTHDGGGLRHDSPIRRRIRGEAWGLFMYQILHGSRITLNHHGSIPPYANNMRLYEATGVGTLLMTDWKENLAEIFEPEREVVTYRTPEEMRGEDSVLPGARGRTASNRQRRASPHAPRPHLSAANGRTREDRGATLVSKIEIGVRLPSQAQAPTPANVKQRSRHHPCRRQAPPR